MYMETIVRFMKIPDYFVIEKVFLFYLIITYFTQFMLLMKKTIVKVQSE